MSTLSKAALELQESIIEIGSDFNGVTEDGNEIAHELAAEHQVRRCGRTEPRAE